MKSTLNNFTPVVKKAVTIFINELISDKIKTALRDSEKTEEEVEPGVEREEEERKRQAVTTEEEIEFYILTKMLLREFVETEHFISYKDTIPYFAITVDNDVRKWICRLYASKRRKVLTFRDDEKIEIENIYDIEKYKEKMEKIVKELIGKD